jgi:hypothetical protein
MVVSNASMPAAEIRMTRLAPLVVMAALALVDWPAVAAAQNQDTPAAAEDANRYSFHRAGEGFVRLDSRTGHVSQCGWRAAGWSCNAMADERAALESEISRLQQENVALKKSLLSRGLDLPGNVKPDASTRKEPDAGAGPKSPSEAEFDRAITFMKNVWRRLVELMVDLQRDMQRKS